MSTPLIIVNVKKPLKNLAKFHDLFWMYTNSAFQALFPIYFYVVISSLYTLEVVAGAAAAEAISLIILTIALYSFEITGLEAISKCDNAPGKKKVVFDILAIRVSLFFALITVCAVIAVLFDVEILKLVLCWVPFVLAVVLQSNYYFLAAEQNYRLFKYLSAAKGSALFLLFLTHNLVINYSNIEALILSAGILHLIPSMVLIFRVVGLDMIANYRPAVRELTTITWNQRNIFLANLGVAFLKDVNPMLMYFLGVRPESLVAYTFAEKLVRAVQGSLRPLNKYLAARLIRHGKQANLPSFRNPILISCALSFLFFIGLISLLWNVGGILPEGSVGSVSMYILIMGISTALGVVNFFLGSIFLNLNEMAVTWRNLIVISALITLSLGVVFIYFMGGIGAAITYVVAEFILLTGVAWVMKGFKQRECSI